MKRYRTVMAMSFAYAVFVGISLLYSFGAGKRAIAGLRDFVGQMALILPAAFVLIGLFEVWIKRETVERYLGAGTGPLAWLLAVVLAGTTVGGLYVAFPFAWSLYKKGARLGVVFTYLSCSGICRIPMTIFEASFLGIRFTAVRFAVSLPLVIVTSWGMERYCVGRDYRMIEPCPVAGREKNG